MLRLDQYPNCQGNCAIREATGALSAYAVRFEDGHIMLQRYLLIRDDADQLVDVVQSPRARQGAVPPFPREDRESSAHIRKLVPFGGRLPSEVFIRWTSLFSKSSREASKVSIQSVMVFIRGTVQAGDSVPTVISTMLCHGVDGVLMTDIFDIIAQFRQGARRLRGWRQRLTFPSPPPTAARSRAPVFPTQKNLDANRYRAPFFLCSVFFCSSRSICRRRGLPRLTPSASLLS